jgi:hypothetical protein
VVDASPCGEGVVISVVSHDQNYLDVGLEDFNFDSTAVTHTAFVATLLV